MAIVVGITAWYAYQVFRPYTGSPSTVAAVSTTGLTNESLKQAATAASNDQNRYGVPVPAPSADELGKDQLF